MPNRGFKDWYVVPSRYRFFTLPSPRLEVFFPTAVLTSASKPREQLADGWTLAFSLPLQNSLFRNAIPTACYSVSAGSRGRRPGGLKYLGQVSLLASGSHRATVHVDGGAPQVRSDDHLPPTRAFHLPLRSSSPPRPVLASPPAVQQLLFLQPGSGRYSSP